MAFKICTIGCGNISNSNHGPAYKRYKEANPDVILAGCCDLDEEKARRYKESFGFERYYTDLHEMIEKEKPDAVCAAVNEAIAAEVGCAVMEHGVPLFLEKPPGKNSTETMRLIETAEKTGVPNMVAFNRHFIPLMRECKEVMKNIKEPMLYIRYDFCRHERNDDDFSDTAIHAIDAVRFLTDDDYEKVTFSYQKVDQRADSVYLQADMKKGTKAFVHVLPGCGIVLERATIHYRDYTILLCLPIWGDGFDIPGSLTVLHNGVVEHEVKGETLCPTGELFITNGFYDENRVFFDSLQQGTPFESTLKRSLQSILVKEAYARGDQCWEDQNKN